MLRRFVHVQTSPLEPVQRSKPSTRPVSMKLDTKAIRYLTPDDWRVLSAVEQGSKNHEVVPTPLIQQIAGLSGGSGVHKCISNLAKVGLIGKVKNARYDGYRLAYGGLDYLALNAHRRSSVVFSLGNQIGVGKESDIYIAASPSNTLQVLKIHRLGRISFRSVKSKRDYLRNRTTGSWMYLSRLSAQREFEIMKVLHREGFAVPQPIAWNRHTVVMEFIDSFPLRMIDSVPHPGELYAELMDIIVQLARRGLIHGDFNEFNILIKEEQSSNGSVNVKPILIDFPQAVSTNHINAEMYFDRDVACVKRYFERKFKYVSDAKGPFLDEALKDVRPGARLDVEVEASGFSKKMARELEKYVQAASQEQKGQEERGDEEDDQDLTEEESEPAEQETHRHENAEDDKLVNQLDGFSLQASLAGKASNAAGYGLVPFDPLDNRDVTPGSIRARKADAGWAI